MTTYPVSQNTVVKRLNRRLAREGLILRLARIDSRTYIECGRFYLVNDNNYVVDDFSDLEAYARDRGALADWEVIEGA